jgi:predicted O-methyltransferase YrrM
MSEAIWATVEKYLSDTLVQPDEALIAAVEANRAAGLPEISVSPNEGKLLHLLARLMGAKRILEIGTLGGYSAIWLARALPAGGRLITLELEPTHAAVAQANLQRAAVDRLVEIRVGKAIDSLRTMIDRGEGPFDLIFIDADKPSNPDYFTAALRLSRPGTLIVVDNVIREGAVIDPQSDNPSVVGVRQLHDLIANTANVSATALQTVGSKGYDGFTLVLVGDV